MDEFFVASDGSIKRQEDNNILQNVDVVDIATAEVLASVVGPDIEQYFWSLLQKHLLQFHMHHRGR